jgi:hypothetical protein
MKPFLLKLYIPNINENITTLLPNADLTDMLKDIMLQQYASIAVQFSEAIEILILKFSFFLT